MTKVRIFLGVVIMLQALIFGQITLQKKDQVTQAATSCQELEVAQANLRDNDEASKNLKLYGSATISPAGEIVAGSLGTWILSYRVGRLGVDDGGQILILMRAACDWGAFQMEDPKGENYVTMRTTGQAKLTARYDPRHAFKRPWMRGIMITVEDGYLKENDEVIVTLGDPSGGGAGTRSQTISQDMEFEFRFMVDAFGTGQPVHVLASPKVRIIGGEAKELEAIWPTEMKIGEIGWLVVRAKDFWGNPAPSYRGTIRFSLSGGVRGLPQSYTFTEADHGFHRFEDIGLRKEGICRIQVKDETNPELVAEINPALAISDSEFHPFWGDLHGQSGESGGLGTVDSYFAYASGFASIDFASHQANDFHITSASWKAIQEASKKYHLPGRFVSFLGYEWSGNTGNGGDHNVIYLEDGQPLYHSSHAQIEDHNDLDTDRNTVRDLVSTLSPGKAILIPHIGGRRANLDFFEPQKMPLVEIYSGHGQFEWFLKEALSRGLKVGFIANSDDVYARPGDSIPGIGLFSVHGGLTCVLSRGLTRKDIWEALSSRRVYATTGERIWLRFKAGTLWMGEEIQTQGPLSFSVQAAGTSGIEQMELFRGTERVYRYSGAVERSLSRIKISWSGARSKQRRRNILWDGEILVSGGHIKDVKPYRFDYPSEGIKHWDNKRIIWNSSTAGDEDGIILDLDATEEAVLFFRVNLGSRDQFSLGRGKESEEFSVNLRQLSGEDWIYPLEGLDCRVAIRRVAETYPREAHFTWKESNLQPGTSAYWVRLLQQDGALAWSSPIFVTCIPKK